MTEFQRESINQAARSTAMDEAVMVGVRLMALFRDQSQWSQETFGTDAERGPIGALKHLQKEAGEAENEAVAIRDLKPVQVSPPVSSDDLKEELADCLLLLLDANRRAGFAVLDLILAAQAKMKVNRTRNYPRPTSDVPSEHIKEAS